MPVPRSVTIRLNARTLLIALVITVTPLVIDMFLVLDRSRADLDGLAGEYFESTAQNAALVVSNYLDSRINDLNMLAASSPVQDVRGFQPSPVDDRFLLETNRHWETPEVAPIVSGIIANPVSVHLRDYLALNTSMQRIMITNSQGVVVAASHKPIKYYFGDQRWWIYAYSDGRSGRVHVGDADWDPVSMTHSIGITVPLLDRDSNTVAALITGFVDVGNVAPLVDRIRFGDTGRSLLVKSDGTVLSGGETELAMTVKAEEMEVIRPLSEQRPRGWAVAPLRGGKLLFVGYHRVPVAEKFPEIDWTVLVEQDLEEVSAPVARVNARALGSGFLAILLVGGLAVYFTTHRPQKLDPMDKVLKAS